MDRRAPGRRLGQAGRGIIGFLIAVIVVGYAIYCFKAFYDVKHKFDVMDDYAYELIRSADLQKRKEDDVKFAIYKRVKELRIPIKRLDDIEVNTDSSGWRVHFSWSETVTIPGYQKEMRFIVDKTWKRF